MVLISKSALYSFELDNNKAAAPFEWQGIEIAASFPAEAVQATITTDNIIFVREERAKIKQFIEDGLNGGDGIFQGMPYNIKAKNINSQFNAFNGFVDLTDDLQIDDFNQRIIARLKKDDGLDQLETRLKPLSYGFLEEELGLFTDADYVDVDYVIQKKDNLIDILIASIILYLMIKELAEAVKDTAKAIADVAAHITGGFTGAIAAIIFSVAVAIIQAAYTALILVAVINLSLVLINALLPIVRKHKAITLRTLLSKVSTHLGYTFVGIAEEFDKVVYLPSNPEYDEEDSKTGLIKTFKSINKGIPNSTDFGYKCEDMFGLAATLINGKYTIIGNELHLRSKNDPFYKKLSTYKMPSVREKVKRYNTDKLNGLRIFNFLTDITDDYTIDNYEGTLFQVSTDAISSSDEKGKFISGLQEVTYNVALGTRKEVVNPLLVALKAVAKVIDGATKTFGKGTNLAARVKDRRGVLVVSNNNHQIAKLLWLENGNIPPNQRDLFSAKSLYDKYHNYESFVANNFGFQRLVFKNVKVPFGFEDFLKVINNSYFTDQNGKEGKIESIKWNLAGDFAIVDYWLEEVYTKNLKETTIEPE